MTLFERAGRGICPTRRGDDPSCNLPKSITSVTPTRLPRTGGTLEVTHEDINPSQKVTLRLTQGSKVAKLVLAHFDLRPKGIVQMLDLLRPIYQKSAAYGHFGREEPEFTWERTDKAQALRAAAGL